MRLRTFTIVPVGGLGNRFSTISGAIAFCQAKQIPLTILWFKDHGLNCDYDKLFSIDPALKNVFIRNGTYADLLLRDNPRRKNFWIPRFFERLNYDKRIYWLNKRYNPTDRDPQKDTSLDECKNVFMVACYSYWDFGKPLRWIVPSETVRRMVEERKQQFAPNTVGVHIRRTDNLVTIKYSPTSLYVEKMKEEVERDPDVKFLLLSDSNDEKERMKQLFGNRILTSMQEVVRNTEQGIIHAFSEMILLSQTRAIYAGESTFSILASYLEGAELHKLDMRAQ